MTLQEFKHILLGTSTSDELHVGDEVVFTAPSGRKYDGIVLEVDFFCNEVNLMVEFHFTRNGKMVRSQGWQSLSRCQRVQ